jgi:glutamine cyclotransferase
MTVGLLAFCGCRKDPDKGGVLNNEPPRPVAPVATASVIRTFPHDTAAFTQGLVWNGGVFYESTGREGKSTLRKVEVETGKVLQQVSVPTQYFAEGLALLNGKLYQLTWQHHVGFVYDLATLHQTGTFPYEGEGWGLTTDGTSLILSDGSNQLRYIDPTSFKETRVVNVMDGTEFVNDINELEWVKGEVWANVWHTDRIARIDPQTGKVKAWVDLTGLLSAPLPDPEAVLNGIAYDAQHDRLFVTGKLWPTIFEIAVPGVAGGGAATGGGTAGTTSSSGQAGAPPPAGKGG